MQNLITKLGQIGIVAVITLLATLSSLLISFIADNMGLEISNETYLMAIITPIIVAPAVTWYIIGLTIEITELEKKMRALANYDVLTGVMNRRPFFTNCASLYHLMFRNESPFSFAYIDIDDFKMINDTYGHPAGDKVLAAFASIVNKRLRKSDVIGRIGGEEFGIALPDTSLKDAANMLDDIRKNVQNSSIEYSGHTIRFTISIGVSVFDQHNAVNLEQLIKNSDTALYEAKGTGKNRIVEFRMMDSASDLDEKEGMHA